MAQSQATAGVAEALPSPAIRKPEVPVVVLAVAALWAVHRPVAPAAALPVADWERAAALVRGPVAGSEPVVASIQSPVARGARCSGAHKRVMPAAPGSPAVVRV